MDFIQHLPYNPVCDHRLTEYHNTFMGRIIHFCPLCRTFVELTSRPKRPYVLKNLSYWKKSKANAIQSLTATDTGTVAKDLVHGGGHDDV